MKGRLVLFFIFFSFLNGKMNIFVGRGKGVFGEGERRSWEIGGRLVTDISWSLKRRRSSIWVETLILGGNI